MDEDQSPHSRAGDCVGPSECRTHRLGSEVVQHVGGHCKYDREYAQCDARVALAPPVGLTGILPASRNMNRGKNPENEQSRERSKRVQSHGPYLDRMRQFTRARANAVMDGEPEDTGKQQQRSGYIQCESLPAGKSVSVFGQEATLSFFAIDATILRAAYNAAMHRHCSAPFFRARSTTVTTRFTPSLTCLQLSVAPLILAMSSPT